MSIGCTEFYFTSVVTVRSLNVVKSNKLSPSIIAFTNVTPFNISIGCTEFYLASVIAVCAYNLTEIGPICVRGELSPKLTVFDLEGRSFALITLSRYAKVRGAYEPVAVFTNVRSITVITVCAGCLYAGIGCTDEPVAVVTDVRSYTVCAGCLYACIGCTDDPVAVFTNVRNYALSLNAGIRSS